MPPIQTIARPRRNRISVSVPSEYSSYSFQVILVPLRPEPDPVPVRKSRHKRSLVDALLACPEDISSLIRSCREEMPSAFAREGYFDSEDFA